VKAGEAAVPREGGRADVLADLRELTKPRITVLVLVTAAAGYLLDPGVVADAALLAWTLVGTALLASGAAALNQVLERSTDALMERTASRPLPSGRLDANVALAFGVLLCLSGLVALLAFVNPLTAMLGAVTVALYAFVYTPLKRLTSLSTLVGAIPGAMPTLMGWAAAHDGLGLGAWALFAILFLWQMPHFLAIAWMYRDDYRRAGFPILSTTDPSGVRTGLQAVLYAAALVPVSLLPTLFGYAGAVYWIGALVLSLGLVAVALAFASSRSRASARRLLLASVLYVPALLPVLFVDRWLG
jgi:protoheme IX farnesyltransferase